jgi:hypothetical protein
VTNDTPNGSDSSKLGPAGWIAIAVLVGFLAWTGWYSLQAWNDLGEVHMTAFGWAMVVLGALLTFALGAGLMWLVFYSSRHDMDR